MRHHPNLIRARFGEQLRNINTLGILLPTGPSITVQSFIYCTEQLLIRPSPANVLMRSSLRRWQKIKYLYNRCQSPSFPTRHVSPMAMLCICARLQSKATSTYLIGHGRSSARY
ncbi:hypothetical protein XPA_006896 [Xanthoria parietina]